MQPLRQLKFKSSAHWDETKWTEADRKTIEKALAAYPVDIPTQAEFYYEGEGWHNFSVSRHIDGALMYDGSLRARYAENGKIEEYKIQITSINKNSQDNKHLIVKITDENLINKTGGIIQGMSGSPIVQNGKLIGAITHVFLNDSTGGYGIFAQTMLENVNKISK